jgi:hypothetical protein
LKQRKLAQRKAVRITATALAGAILLGAIAFAALYRWPVSYRVGTVTGTDMISRDDFVKAVDDAASTWNRAAGRTVAWRLPIGRRVSFDIEFDTSFAQYLRTLADLEYKEAALLAGKNAAQDDLNNIRVAYDWALKYPSWSWSTMPPDWWKPPKAEAAPSLPTTGTIKRLDLGFVIVPVGVKWWSSRAVRRPTLQDVKFYERAATALGEEWLVASDRLQTFKRASSYTDDPSDIDAGVRFNEGPPTVVTITYFADTHPLTDVLVRQFGRLLLGRSLAHGAVVFQAASPLKSPWKTRLFDTTGR